MYELFYSLSDDFVNCVIPSVIAWGITQFTNKFYNFIDENLPDLSGIVDF